ncbi:hypothetical protein F4802DRAFT_593553 [Xylaria palmicola]|nr:hypothetical protein F4802DRAFT_593553 [Xylaria palmicola]
MSYVYLALLALPHLADAATVSLTQVPAFASQRPCAQNCFSWSISDGVGRLADGIGCDYQDPENECVCRPDLQANAEAFIQNCVNKGCSQNTLDTNSAVSIYDAYCTDAGFKRETPATPTSGTGDSPSTVTVTVTATVRVSSARKQSAASPLLLALASALVPSSFVTSNSAQDSSSQDEPGETEAPAPTNSKSAGSSGGSSGSSSGSGNNNNGLSTGEIIGIVVGILGFLATAVGSWFSYKAIMNKKRYPRF